MDLFFFFGAAIIGLIIGSFLSMLIPRLHYGEGGIFFGRSQCGICKTVLKVTDLIPVLSFVMLRGRCRHCQKRFSFWYPAIELTSAALFGLLTFYAGSWSIWAWQAGLFTVLLFIAFYDLRFKEIHDGVMLPGIIFAFIASCFIGNPIDALIGGGIGFAFFGLQWLASRGKWIGSGDMRIGAFMGLMLGWHLTLLAIVISYIFGSLISLFLMAIGKADRKTALPLGPFLVVGTMIAFFYGEQLLTWYLTI